MAPKLRFTPEEVADAAFRQLQEKGFAAVTARAIATMLGASTMPIYSAIGSMDELMTELRRRALALLAEYERKPYTDNPYLNKATGYISFSRSEKNVFRFLFIDAPVALEDQEALVHSEFPDRQAQSQWFGQIDEAAMGAIAFKSYFFVHGLAMALALGTVRGFDDAKIIRLLQEAGGAFLMFEKSTGGNVV